MTRQSHRLSILETLVDVSTGFVISWAITWLLLPLWGYSPTVGAAIEITAVFTVASLSRKYVIRRIFNRVKLDG